jgi:hypothetical protein
MIAGQLKFGNGRAMVSDKLTRSTAFLASLLTLPEFSQARKESNPWM